MTAAEPPAGREASHSGGPARSERGAKRSSQGPSPRALLMGAVVAAFGAGLVFLLVGEHRVHVLGWAPYLLLLLCPLLHLGMHGSHGGHRGEPDGDHPASKPSVPTHPHQS